MLPRPTRRLVMGGIWAMGWFSGKSLKRCHQMSDLKAKMHQNQFWLGLSPRQGWEGYSSPPDPLAGFKGPTSKRRAGREGEGKKGEQNGGEVRWGVPALRWNAPLPGWLIRPWIAQTLAAKVSTMRFIDELETRYYLNLFIFLKQLGFIEYDVLLNIEYYWIRRLMKMTALNLHRYISIGRVVCILFTNFCLQSAIRRTTYTIGIARWYRQEFANGVAMKLYHETKHCSLCRSGITLVMQL